jgi:hypothetical protein
MATKAPKEKASPIVVGRGHTTIPGVLLRGVRIVAEQGAGEMVLPTDECQEKLQQAARTLPALFGNPRWLQQAAEMNPAKNCPNVSEIGASAGIISAETPLRRSVVVWILPAYQCRRCFTVN